jgi:two-component system OmpR family response regulator
VRVRVLIIEDDARAARLLERGLVAEGFAVTVAEDGNAGLTQLTEQGFDACVLDLQLPGLHGLHVLERARAADVKTPVLILTSNDAVPDRVRGLNLGADDYLPKPFSFEELVARLRALLRRGAPQRAPILRFQGLELDPTAHEVKLRGRRLQLSPRQFSLLEFLMRHQGEVVPRALILERVWGYTFDTGTNVVEVHIAHLRQQIDRPGGPSLIETVRGVGYRLGRV